MKKETLFQYLTRRTGFGRTPWFLFVIILAWILGLAYVAVAHGDPVIRGVCGAFSVAIALIMAGGTWENFKRDSN